MNSMVADNIAETVPAVDVKVSGRTIILSLYDGRTLSFPADRYVRLKNATDQELQECRLELDGRALRWEKLDEDLTVAGILAGRFQLPLA